MIKVRKRRDKGNMLIFITASTFILLGGIAFFALGYVRLLGTNSEQRSAIEAAALTAARDMSRIAIETEEYGWIGLSDSAPNGAGTKANDQFYVPVKSINTILATNRVDMLIAEQLGDDSLKLMLKQDLDWALDAQNKLKTELQNSMASGYKAKDAQGQDVEVYKDALAAYNANGVRMTGSSNYVAGSLKLTLGTIIGGAPTNTPTPKPNAMANVPSSAQNNGNYLSYTVTQAGGHDYVFAGIADSIKLVDSKKWQASTAGLPYQLPTIVKAEADQQLKGHEINGNVVHAMACAQPANIIDPRPTPGALTFSFPDGLCPEVTNPGMMLTYAPINKGGTNKASYQYSDNGDFPVDPGSSMNDMPYPYDGKVKLNVGTVFRKALMDWWQRAGTKLHIGSAVAMMTDPAYNFKAPNPAIVDWKTPAKVGDKTIYNLGPIPNGNIHIYRIDPDTGKISYQAKQLDPIEIPIAPENQLYSESLDAIKNSSVGKKVVGPFEFPNTGYLFDSVTLLDKWDIYIRDMVYQSGGKWGGQHGGEPMNHPKTAYLPEYSKPVAGIMDLGSSGLGAWGPPPKGPPQPYNPGTKGKGLPPAITNQSDLAETAGYPKSFYQTYAVGSGIRPTYTTNGMAVDIRFRRQLDAGTFADTLGFKIGYVGEKYGDAVPAVTMKPYVPPPDPEPVPTTDTGTGTDTGAATGTDTSGGVGGATGTDTATP